MFNSRRCRHGSGGYGISHRRAVHARVGTEADSRTRRNYRLGNVATVRSRNRPVLPRQAVQDCVLHKSRVGCDFYRVNYYLVCSTLIICKRKRQGVC